MALLLYLLLLALVSLLPNSSLPTIPDWTSLFSPDKVAHFAAYALLALLLSAEAYPRKRMGGIGLAILAAALFGAALEFLQAVIGTGRSFDPVDMVANALGALLGGLLATLVAKLWK